MPVADVAVAIVEAAPVADKGTTVEEPRGVVPVPREKSLEYVVMEAASSVKGAAVDSAVDGVMDNFVVAGRVGVVVASGFCG